jgi:hypothetical protein
MHPICKSNIVRVNGAGDDPFMLRRATMLSGKIPTIEGEHGAFGGGRKCNDLLIRDFAICLSRFHGSQDIVAQEAQLNDHRKRKIFV